VVCGLRDVQATSLTVSASGSKYDLGDRNSVKEIIVDSNRYNQCNITLVFGSVVLAGTLGGHEYLASECSTKLC
jgi:hypothetical protein